MFSVEAFFLHFKYMHNVCILFDTRHAVKMERERLSPWTAKSFTQPHAYSRVLSIDTTTKHSGSMCVNQNDPYIRSTV